MFKTFNTQILYKSKWKLKHLVAINCSISKNSRIYRDIQGLNSIIISNNLPHGIYRFN